MAKNKDNEQKMSNGALAKLHTNEAIQECEVIKSTKKGPNLSKNKIEPASCDLQIVLNNHPDVTILLHSTFSLRPDRLVASNANMSRLKRRLGEQKKKVICIMATDNDNERAESASSALFNGYNFEEREDVGIDFIVHNADLSEVFSSMNGVDERNDVTMMIKEAKKIIKKKNY